VKPTVTGSKTFQKKIKTGKGPGGIGVEKELRTTDRKTKGTRRRGGQTSVKGVRGKRKSPGSML